MEQCWGVRRIMSQCLWAGSDTGFIFWCCKISRSYDIIVSFQNALIEVEVQGLCYVTQRLLCSCYFQRIAWIWAEQLKGQQALASFLLAIIKIGTNETQLSSCKRGDSSPQFFLFVFLCVVCRVVKKELLKRCKLFQTVFIVIFSFTVPPFQAKDFQGNSDFNALYTYHITPQGNYHMQDN